MPTEGYTNVTGPSRAGKPLPVPGAGLIGGEEPVAHEADHGDEHREDDDPAQGSHGAEVTLANWPGWRN